MGRGLFTAPLLLCKRMTHMPLLRVPQNAIFFLLFICLHHPNNRLENIPLPLFNSVSKNNHIEIFEGHSSPLHYPPPQLNLCLYISIDKVGKSKHNNILLRYRRRSHKKDNMFRPFYYNAIIMSDMEN
jgi:hypothetical protein